MLKAKLCIEQEEKVTAFEHVRNKSNCRKNECQLNRRILYKLINGLIKEDNGHIV